MEEQGVADLVCRRLGFEIREPDLAEWRQLVEKSRNLQGEVKIALVGKYVSLHDAYLSVAEALFHAGLHLGVQVNIKWIDSEDIEANGCAQLEDAAGIIVPGGFGDRGIEGKIAACAFARAKGIPLFGICLGMQCMVIEFARNEAGIADAHSSEFSDTAHPVITLMDEQRAVEDKGGTMRLGRTLARSSRIAASRIFMERRLSTNATATATSSTTFTGNSWRPKAWCSAASLPMRAWWRSLSSQGILGTSARNFIRSLSPDPIAPIPSSRTSSPPA